MAWKKIIEHSSIVSLIKKSKEKPIVLIKHSPRCSISKVAIGRFQKFDMDKYGYYVVDVIRNRDISLALAETFKIKHESPQLLLIKDGKVENYWNHYQVSPNVLK